MDLVYVFLLALESGAKASHLHLTHRFHREDVKHLQVRFFHRARDERHRRADGWL